MYSTSILLKMLRQYLPFYSSGKAYFVFRRKECFSGSLNLFINQLNTTVNCCKFLSISTFF